MSVAIEDLFTTALGLQSPLEVKKVELNTAKRCIDFEVTYRTNWHTCPVCGAPE